MSIVNPSEIRASWKQGPYCIAVDKDRKKQMIFIEVNPMNDGYLTINEAEKLMEKLQAAISFAKAHHDFDKE